LQAAPTAVAKSLWIDASSGLVVENGVIGQAYFNAPLHGVNITGPFGLDVADATLGMFGLRSSFGLTY
jgi:hypothetical protein